MESKKRYFGYAWEHVGMLKDDKYPFEAKGIETVRRDGVVATSDILKLSARILFDQTVEYPTESIRMSVVTHAIQQEIVKLLTNPAKHIQKLTFAKQYRGMHNYSAHAKLGALKIANNRLQYDLLSIPAAGSRVKYLIRKGSGDESLYDRSEDVTVFLEGQAIPDVNYYVSKQIMPALHRFLGLLKGTKETINLDRIHKEAIEFVEDQNEEYGSEYCVGCGDYDEVKADSFLCIVCSYTAGNAEHYFSIGDRINNKIQSALQNCRKCQFRTLKMRKISPKCSNFDCDNFYKLKYYSNHAPEYINKTSTFTNFFTKDSE